MRPGPTPPFQSTVASVLLDALRGIAALLVCAGHWRYLLFVDYPQIPLHRGWFFLPYLMCTMGHQAVIVFFVLSGYLVGGHVLRALDTGRWSWGAYLLQRGVRLWVVLLPALVLGGILDFAALHLHLAPALYAGQVNNHITFDVHATLTWKALLGNCFFLQTIATPVFGSNGALWSLANEFWYYLIFPLGLLALRGPYSILKRIAMGVACLGLAYGVGPGIRMLLLVWLLGVLLAILPVWRTTAWMRWLALALYCPFFSAVSRGGITGRFPPNYALGLATFGLLYVLLGAREVAAGRWYEQPSRTVAGFSYTLYLVHMPMLMLLTALLAGETRWVPDARHIAVGLVVLLFVVGSAYLLAKGTEFRTAEVRDWLKQLLPKRAKGVATTK
jgi:peptidoglycan/LPS O-acetylase OafA/YrhL